MKHLLYIPFNNRAASAKSKDEEKLRPQRWSSCLNIQWNEWSLRYSISESCNDWNEKIFYNDIKKDWIEKQTVFKSR